MIAMIAKEIALIADKRLQLKVKNWYNSENLTSHPVCSTAIRLSSLLSSQQLFGDGYLANVIFWVNVAVFFSK